jgi:hypothetical protein
VYLPRGNIMDLTVNIQYSREGDECLDQTVGISNSDISFDYTDTSDFLIKPSYYSKYFKNSNEKDCPFESFLLTWDPAGIEISNL